jgi:hypothetical protein
MAGTRNKSPKRFTITDRSSVPKNRHGKHDGIVTEILENLKTLDSGKALKISLEQLPDTKVNVRSALNRATRKLGMKVSTAADDDYLYVWNGA